MDTKIIQRNISKLLKVGVIISALFFTISFMSRWSWIAELTVSLSLLHLFLNIFLLGCLLVFRLWRWSGVVVFLCALQLLRLLVFSEGSPSYAISESSSKFRIFQYNVYFHNSKGDDLVNWVRENHHELDVLFFFETLPNMKEKLKELSDLYPYQVNEPNEAWYTQVVYSKFPVKKHEVIFYDNSSHYLSCTQIENEGEDVVDAYSIHATTPLSGSYMDRRNWEFQQSAEIIKSNPNKRKFLVGDFNVTPHSTHFRQLLETSQLKAPSYPLFENTWPNWLPSFVRTTLDHCLVSDDFEIVSRKVGPELGSDHLPVITEVALKK